MIYRVLFFVASIFLLVTAQAKEGLFKIPPYTLRKPSGEVLLKFEVNKDTDLEIQKEDAFTKSFLLNQSKTYSQGQLYDINIGTIECDQAITININDIKNAKNLLRKELPIQSCQGNKDSQEFSFGFVSDTQEFDARHRLVAKVIEQHQKIRPLQFILNAGDVVQTGDKESEWIRFFNTGFSYLQKTPIIAAIGNHDYRGMHKKNRVPPLFQKYLRWNDANSLGNLSFDFPGFRFLVLNSNFWRISRKYEKKTWNWIESQLIGARNKGLPVIISMHFPVYSSSLNQFTSGSVRKLRRKLVPLLKRYGVKLVLSGHTHMYERSYKDGTHFVVAGPAGGKKNKPSWKNKYQKYINFKALTFTKISLKDEILRLQTFDQDNVLIDKLTLHFPTSK